MLTKIFPAPVIKEIDRLTIENQGISSEQLMERAVDALLKKLLPRLDKRRSVMIFSGVGNNGGDGLVLARKLFENGFNVIPVVVPFSSKRSEDFEINFRRLGAAGVKPLNFDTSFHEEADVLIDAIFGVGLNRPASGLAADAIHYINTLKHNGRVVFSVDMPSGLYADQFNKPSDPVVEADRVFTFQFPKLSFFFKENEAFVPVFDLVDIGLDRQVIERKETKDFYVTAAPFSPVRRGKFTSKADYGHVAVLGGVGGKSGAVILASLAALRAGAGWVTAYVPEETAEVIRAMRPEIMTAVVKSGENRVEDFRLYDRRVVPVAGPGLGTHFVTAQALKKFLKNWKKPVVLDADALNILANHPGLFAYLPEASVLTPHEGELKRLTGTWKNTPDKWDKAVRLARENKVIVVAKGRYTLTTDGERRFFNSTGNPALAKAGSGDVLAGMLGAFLAQGTDVLDAVLSAVYWHGFAADLWVEKNADFSMLPTDLIEYLRFTG